MLKLKAHSKIKSLIADEAGTVALDYGMIVSILAVAVITGLSPLGNNLGTSFKAAADAVLAAPSATPPPPAAPPPVRLAPKAVPKG